MPRRIADLNAFLTSRRRTLATLVIALMVFNALVVVSRELAPDDTRSLAADGRGLPPGSEQLDDGTIRLPDGTVISSPDGNAAPVKRAGPKSTKITRRDPRTKISKVMGVTDTTIKVVYYWKGERTMSSPYLTGTSAEGANLDEALAFREFIKFINRHDGDGTRFMGIPIDLHGRKLEGIVVEAGNGDFAYAQKAEEIAAEIKPFAAISSHGGLSTYICPRLAEAGIFNLSTYDIGGRGGTLADRSNGYCIPSGLSWERQIDLTIAYLTDHRNTGYGPTQAKRVYGVIYSQYPGLKDVAPAMITRLRRAGIPIPDGAVAKIPADLATSQTAASNIVAQMREHGVNTLIMPEANTPLNMTHANQANGWDPDYFIWPCSGQDSVGMVRLFNAAQWEGAEGLTCYDEHFQSDVVNNDIARRSEWYKQYQEIHGTSSEAPAPAPLVYSGLAQLIAGITYAGRDLNPTTFMRAYDDVSRFRYDAVSGRTSRGMHMMIDIATSDRSWIADAAKIRWSGTASNPGSATPGRYIFSDAARYASASDL